MDRLSSFVTLTVPTTRALMNYSQMYSSDLLKGNDVRGHIHYHWFGVLIVP
jgi:hypothetical protein